MVTAERRLPVGGRVRRIACPRPVDAVRKPPDPDLAAKIVCVHDSNVAPDVDNSEPETCKMGHQRGRRHGAGHDLEMVDTHHRLKAPGCGATPHSCAMLARSDDAEHVAPRIHDEGRLSARPLREIAEEVVALADCRSRLRQLGGGVECKGA